MVTLVGKEKEVAKLLNDLLELEFDAIEAYQTAIEKLEDVGDKREFGSFLADHHRHVGELTACVQALGVTAATKGDLKRVLTQGKVALMGLLGDRAIMMAMKTNEDDTNTAYERAVSRGDLTSAIMDVVQRALADERRHRSWIVARIASHKPAHV
jgi:uncharacterized protein (TIGR02284 family)